MPNELMTTILNGIFGSLLGILVAHPIDTIKTRLQTIGQIDFGRGEYLYNGAFDCFYKIIKREGIFSLYRGFSIELLGLFPITFISIGTYELLSTIVKQRKEAELNNLELLFLCGVAGGLPTVLTTPLERIKVQLQIPSGFYEHPSTTFWVCKTALKNDGFLGLWRGFYLTLLRDGKVAALTCFTYRILWENYFKYQNFLTAMNNENNYKKYIPFGLCGGISGVIGWILAAPIDFMKTRLQSIPHDSKDTGIGLQDIIDHIRDEAQHKRVHSLRIYYTGCKLVFLRAFFQYAAVFVGYQVYTEMTHDKTLKELYEENFEKNNNE